MAQGLHSLARGYPTPQGTGWGLPWAWCARWGGGSPSLIVHRVLPRSTSDWTSVRAEWAAPLGASAHSLDEVGLAARLGLEWVFLSPVLHSK